MTAHLLRVPPADFAAQLDLIRQRVRHAGLEAPAAIHFPADGRIDVQVRSATQTVLWASLFNLPMPQQVGRTYREGSGRAWREYKSKGQVDGIRVSVWCSVDVLVGAS